MREMMERWVAQRPTIEDMSIERAVRPTAGPGEVLVRCSAVSLNYRDLAMLEGKFGAWTGHHYPGSELAGEVVELGAGVTRVGLGDRVISVDIHHWIDGPAPEAHTNTTPLSGALAEYVVLPEEQLVQAPKTLDLPSASTLSVAGLTAWFALVELGKMRAGQTVVVHGTGGVSLFAIQFAVAQGASVIVVSRSNDKLSKARFLGADHGINRTEHENWDAEVLAVTEGRGADHVLEMAGGDITRSLNAIRLGGRISVIGLLDDAELRAPLPLIMFKRAQLIGLGVGHRRALEDMVSAVDQIKLTPVVESVYPFARANEAFAHLKRGAFGKVVVRILPPDGARSSLNPALPNARDRSHSSYNDRTI
ncbi:NAD(P)-dependent alcohol dehydrogenase [Cupriavidus sp. 2SB]|uniref:zinc-dependent alcohol dehydrogenase family protein n=1 Tax=Cupriavidus sp. 2SB TaxID=2502199 RepID=UPI0020176E19|nr:NAD(P)-dependent alcohol dehydrogenase [Cupriavidus sp. 2SB]